MIHRFSSTSTESNKSLAGQARIGFRDDISKRNPLIQLHDTESLDHTLVATIGDEITNISGAEVIVYLRTDHEGFDDVYEEDANPTYKSGVRLKAYFVPQPISAQLTPWGVDVENQSTVVFSKEEVIREFGDRLIRIGDVIALPYNAAGIKPDKYRVLNAFDSGNYRYKWLYWSCYVENIPDDITIDVDNS